jgi:PAS domain S-box-containing protein
MQHLDNKEISPEIREKIEQILANNKITLNNNSKNTTVKGKILNTISTKVNTAPRILDSEIKIDPAKTIMSKTNARGIIEFANEYFMEVSGYEEYELMGKPHNIIRHPDMPKVIFKELWNRLHKGENIYALVKNLAKDGRYYWVLTSFETKYDENGHITSHYARRKAAPSNAVYQIEKLYKTLQAIEKNQSIEVAVKYFRGMLEEKGLDYDQFIFKILGTDEKSLASYFNIQSTSNTSNKKKKGIISRLFGK